MKKNSRFKILLLLTALLCPGSSAFGEETTLVIEMLDGKNYSYRLSQKPAVHFLGNFLRITTGSVETVLTRSQVNKFYFSGNSTDISEIANEELMTFNQTAENEFAVSNLSDNDRIIVSNLSGRFYNSCISRSGSNATISLSGCPKGVYIIKIGNKQSIKITKR